MQGLLRIGFSWSLWVSLLTLTQLHNCVCVCVNRLCAKHMSLEYFWLVILTKSSIVRIFWRGLYHVCCGVLLHFRPWRQVEMLYCDTLLCSGLHKLVSFELKITNTRTTLQERELTLQHSLICCEWLAVEPWTHATFQTQMWLDCWQKSNLATGVACDTDTEIKLIVSICLITLMHMPNALWIHKWPISDNQTSNTNWKI